MIPPADWALIALITTGCAVMAIATGALLLRVLHRRSITTHLAVVSFAAIVTVAASIVMTTEAMFLSGRDSFVVLLVCCCRCRRQPAWRCCSDARCARQPATSRMPRKRSVTRPTTPGLHQ